MIVDRLGDPLYSVLLLRAKRKEEIRKERGPGVDVPTLRTG